MLAHIALAAPALRGPVAWPGLARSVAPTPTLRCSARPLSGAASPALRPSLSSFSDEENALRDTVGRFAREAVGPLVSKMDEQEKVDPDVLRACFEQGLMGVEVPVEYGGAGMSFTSSLIVIEELAKVDPSLSVIVDIQNTLISTILMRWGNQKQKEQWLPRLATDTLGSFCLSEWQSGSDAFALKTSAVKKGDEYIINGTKAWISNADAAGVMLVMATVDPSRGYKGITSFIVDAHTPGISISKKERKCGLRASATCEVQFDNVVVPAANVLHSEGVGYKIAIEALNEGRIGIGAQMLGLAEGCFDLTMKYITQRKQFGQVISSFQMMQYHYANLATEIEAARLLVYNASRLKEEGRAFLKEAAMAKLYASEMAGRVSSKCVDLAGGMGYVRDTGIEKFFRDAKIGVIYEGTSNLQLVTIAKMLEKEYAADK